MEKIRTVTIKDRGKVVMALCHGQITSQEAFDWMVEADNRDWIKQKREEKSSSLFQTLPNPNTPYHTGPHLT